eukprot:gene12375-8501_t
MMDPASYWQSRAEAAVEEYEATLQAQRNELEALQRQVSNLLHERSLMKAATANDVRAFCLNYQATAAQQPQQPSAIGGPPFSSFTAFAAGGGADVIPIYDLLLFLHRYSNGLVPPPENRRKRLRTPSSCINALYGSMGGADDSIPVGSPSASPGVLVPANAAAGAAAPAAASHLRLYHRMLARQRGMLREGDMEDYVDHLVAQQQQQQQQMGMNEGGGENPQASSPHPQPRQ